MRRYHVIEKGLSMPDFRPRFGMEMVTKLVNCLQVWDTLKKCSSGAGGENQISAARAVLLAYAKKHKELNIDISDFLPETSLPDSVKESQALGGTKFLETVSVEDRAAFRRVVGSRVSVRDFVTERVPSREMIQQAIEMAVTSPSVCNRQTWRVHAYEGARAQEILALQNGNRGFGHRIPMVLAVTSDMRFFTGTIERYQSWIDGGMFSMTLLLGLHAQGLGAVPLNWSVRNKQDVAMRNDSGIPDHERIIMLIGCGYPSEGTVVANSQRRPGDTFIRWADDASGVVSEGQTPNIK
jgi:nitroreductase